MSDYYDNDYPEADGTCHDCGIDLDDDTDGDHDENHTRCWKCWREANGIPEQPWRKKRPAAGTEPASFVEGLAQVRERLAKFEAAVCDGFTEVEARLDRLERALADKR